MGTVISFSIFSHKLEITGTTSLNLPFCAECHLACQRSSYVSYASYGDGFNNSSMTWIMNLTGYKSTYIKWEFHDGHHNNIRMISEKTLQLSIFTSWNYSTHLILKSKTLRFGKLWVRIYSKIKNCSLYLLDQIFGLNGLWFGMSVVSLTELILYITKVSWLAVTRRRRKHLFQKKMSEKVVL